MQTVLMTLAIALACLAAAWFDLRERRIPNLLTMGALVVALLLRVPGGAGEIGAGLAGALLAGALALPFFLVGGLGGGDLKFLAAIGAFLGPARLFFALLVMALFGAGMAVFAILRRRALPETFANLHVLISTFGRRNFSGWRKDADVPLTIHSPAVITVPYGVAIAAGALTAWFVYTTVPGWSLMAMLAG
ncbi:MAG: prepilin peptidase [Gemmatimonadota bacterium]|nr:MAG: prepilin peptidase [Gemmatimonadota bacterium]